jgi:hypothetical protein
VTEPAAQFFVPHINDAVSDINGKEHLCLPKGTMKWAASTLAGAIDAVISGI